ncbi:hypothetical protein KBC79_05625, partial [Candidatus Woesebacteria bacterium]|nr:hypothetical protein [Candidatus Woesebacteria bacterium]
MSERPRRNDNLQQVTTSDLLQELSNRARSGSLTREQLDHLKRFAEVELRMIENKKTAVDQTGGQTSVVSAPNKQPQVEQMVDREALLLKEIVGSITRWTAHG